MRNNYNSIISSVRTSLMESGVAKNGAHFLIPATSHVTCEDVMSTV